MLNRHRLPTQMPERMVLWDSVGLEVKRIVARSRIGVDKGDSIIYNSLNGEVTYCLEAAPTDLF
jgi:hypothetical protein